MLNPKQQRFVAEYLVNLNATQAAIKAGYSAKTAESQGSRLLSNAKVAALVAEGQAKRLDKAELTAVRVLEELRRLAFSDLRRLFDEQGNLRQIHELSAEDAACLASIEVVRENAQPGDGHMDNIHKIKVYDKTKALDMLAKHFGLLVERVEHSGGLEISWKDSE